MSEIIPQEVVENKILFIRGKKVMLDKDLAALSLWSRNKSIKSGSKKEFFPIS
jgi:hypothetical protein